MKKLRIILAVIVFLATTSFSSNTNSVAKNKYFFVQGSCPNCDKEQNAAVYCFISDIICGDVNNYKIGLGAFFNQMTINYPNEFVLARNGQRSFGFDKIEDAKAERQNRIAEWKRQGHKIYYVNW